MNGVSPDKDTITSSDGLYAYLKDSVTAPSSTPDMLNAWLRDEANRPSGGATNDLWMIYLESLGYSQGSLEDRLFQANLDGVVLSVNLDTDEDDDFVTDDDSDAPIQF